MSDAQVADIEAENEDDMDDGEDEGEESLEGSKDPQLDATTATFDPFAQAVEPVSPYGPGLPAQDARPEAFDDPAFAPGTPQYPPRNRHGRNGGGSHSLPDGFTLHVKPPAPQPKAPSEPKYDPLRFLARQKEGRIRIKRLIDSVIDSKGYYKTAEGERVKVGHGECGFMPAGSPEEMTNYIKDVWGGGTYELTHFDKDDKMITQGIMSLPQVPKPIDGVEEEDNEYDDMETYPPQQGGEMPYVPGMPIGRGMGGMGPGMGPGMGGMGRSMDPRLDMGAGMGVGGGVDEYGRRRMPPIVNSYRPPEELLEARKELELLKQRLDMEKAEKDRIEKQRMQDQHANQLSMLKKEIEDTVKFTQSQKIAETESLKAQLESLKAAVERPRTDPALPMVEMMRLQQEEASRRAEKELELRRIEMEKEAKERQAQREITQAQLERESRERAAQIQAQLVASEKAAALAAEQARLQAAALAAQQPKTDPIVMMMESMRMQAEQAQRKWEQERDEQRRRDEREKEDRERKDREDRERREAERAERDRKEREDRERREDERKEKERREREEREERRLERERAERREEEKRKYEQEKEEQRRREDRDRDEQRRREQAEQMKFLFDQQKATVGATNPLQMLREALKLGNEIKDTVGGDAPVAEKDTTMDTIVKLAPHLAPLLAGAAGAIANRVSQPAEPQQPVIAPQIHATNHQVNPNPQPTPEQLAAREAAAREAAARAAQQAALRASQAQKQENQAQMIGQYAQILKAASVAYKDKKTPVDASKDVFAKAVELNAKKNLDMLKGKSIDEVNGFILLAKNSGLVGGMNLAALEEFASILATPEGNKWVSEVLEALKVAA